jgi:hypothetical protein
MCASAQLRHTHYKNNFTQLVYGGKAVIQALDFWRIDLTGGERKRFYVRKLALLLSYRLYKLLRQPSP